MNRPSNTSPPLRDGFLFVGAGLGDVARRFYRTTTYELLNHLETPTPVICYSHNPSALEFFRFHPNHRNIILYDMGHYYMGLMRQGVREAAELNRRVFAVCGYSERDLLAKPRSPLPITCFHAPDTLPDTRGCIVVHPFGRGWGDWPTETCDRVVAALSTLPRSIKIFIIAAHYRSTDGRNKNEEFACALPNARILHNLSAPAAFSLVASASRFIGTMSSLAQVAAFERIPSVVLHPARCRDFGPDVNGYAKSILEADGVNLPYDTTDPAMLTNFLREFLLPNGGGSCPRRLLSAFGE